MLRAFIPMLVFWAPRLGLERDANPEEARGSGDTSRYDRFFYFG